MRIAFVHNFCSHYTLKLFERLARVYEIDYYFASKGDDPYWLKEHGIREGDFKSEYLESVRLGTTRIVLSLPRRLLSRPYDVYMKGITGRFEIVVTYLIARLRRKPFILWTGIWSRMHSPIQRISFPLVRRLYQHSDAIIVYGEHVRKYLVSEGVLPNRIFVAPHSVDNELYSRAVSDEEKDSLLRRLGIPLDARVILYLGRFVFEKGLSYLMEAFEMLRMDDTVLLLAGAGPERANLERLVEERGLQGKVVFSGYVPVEEAASFYSLAWVFVLPSVTTKTFKEPWGLTVNEAFNQGVPVIGTDSVGAGAGGLLRHEVNGLIIRERDSSHLLEALRRILVDDALRQEWSRNARKAIHDWNYEGMVRGFEGALTSVTKQGSDGKASGLEI